MSKPSFRVWGILLLIAVLAAGCASPQAAVTTQPAAPATTDTSPNTAAPSAPAVTASTTAPTSGMASTGGTATSPSQPAAGGAIRYDIVQGSSSAEYKVREQLANINFPSDAIGKTQDIAGTISINPDGSINSADSKFVVNVDSLTSDRSQRDNFLRRNSLQTSQYPQVVFVPTHVSGLPSPLPASGQVTFKLTGNLTVRDVTKPVTWDVTATVDGSQLTGTATISFKFEDFNIPQPQVPVVLSVVDNITLDLNFVMQKTG